MSQPHHNLELKARLADLARGEAVARELGARYVETLRQTDTYFHAPNGRLKLRETDGKPAELIGYTRPDEKAARTSAYRLFRAAQPAELKAILAATLGVRTIVVKSRRLWQWENVRLHFDDVAGRGLFFECEAVLSTDADAAHGAERVQALREALGLRDENLIAGSYGDV